MNIFKITLENNFDNYEKAFKAAFEDIYALTKLICDSENEVIQNYVDQPFEEDDTPWLSYNKNKHSVIIFAEVNHVHIEKEDYLLPEVVYDFGKRSPADDMFLCAVMSIFKHHIPDAIIGNEAAFNKSFEDGAYLATLINPLIRNPYADHPSKNAKKIYSILKAL